MKGAPPPRGGGEPVAHPHVVHPGGGGGGGGGRISAAGEGGMKMHARILVSASPPAPVSVYKPARARARPSQAQDFYKGRTITIVVGFTPGGGFDANARLLSRHWADHIPGNPDVVVSNMPGAASMVAVNYLDASAAKDGTVVVTFNYGQMTASRIQSDKVKADFRNYNWIGSIAEDPEEFCFLPKKAWAWKRPSNR